MTPKNVKCERFIAGPYKNTKNKQCTLYLMIGDVGPYLSGRDASKGPLIFFFQETELH